MKAKQEHGLASVTRRAAGLTEKWGSIKPHFKRSSTLNTHCQGVGDKVGSCDPTQSTCLGAS